MTRLTDTSPEALGVLIDCYRRMTPGRKWAILGDTYRFARTLHAAGVRDRNPAATDEQVRRDWILLHLGNGPWLTVSSGAHMPPQPIEHQQVIVKVLTAFAENGIACAIGGSVASSLYGVPRYTQDADLTSEPFPGREEQLARAFGADYHVSLAAVRDANQKRGSFNIIHTPSGFKVDVFIQKTRPFDRGLLDRRLLKPDVDPSGNPVPVLSPEDIVLHKLEWFRLGGKISDRQWGDILGVLRVQGDRLDSAYLDHWAADLGVADLLAKARAEAAPPPPEATA
jgi:hypothetical protein